MSGSGPFGPITHGVWQSLQPATVTRYLPRASFSALVSTRLESAAEVCARAGVATVNSDANGNREHGVFERNAFHAEAS